MTKSASYEELKRRVESLENQITKFKQNEVSLKESEKRFRILLDFAPYPVATFTLNGNISYLNPSFTKVFGWTLDDMKKGRLYLFHQSWCMKPQRSSKNCLNKKL